MHTHPDNLPQDAVTILQKVAENKHLRDALLEYIGLYESKTWVASAVESLVRMSTHHGHGEYAMEPTDVYNEVTKELKQWRIDMSHALDLQTLYPRAFAQPVNWHNENPEPSPTEAA
ncbi:MAG TPA: hypothetical protein VGK29_06325 [Paludibaculum sp.]|jgi:hypothetical protein